jgi:eukaryotic-like serine/threonine-protein kinase
MTPERSGQSAAGPSDSLVGQQISHYKIQSLLGAGGMGEVYLARDTRLDRTIALKMLPASFASDQDRMQRFIREAKAASAFNHPNVAAIHDIGEAEGHHFIVMEYVEGQTLAARIAGRPMLPADIIDIVIQVADALHEAHAKGITHRDIKPANLMLTPRGQVKVLDFGLAKMSSESANGSPTEAVTQIGSVLGTVQYMSPEQVLGRPVDHRSDIFSLGVVLYEMATGRLPFSGASVGETMDRILHSHPESIVALDQSELPRIIRKCLEKDRERRYQTARDLWVDLKNLQRDSDSATIIEGPDSRRFRGVRQNVLGKRAWLLGAAAAVVITGFFLVRWLREPAPVLSFAPRDWVLVTDIENHTGDAVFDKSIQTALLVGLEQSRYSNVFPRTRSTESLKRMKKAGTEPIDETLGREIALREGIRALIIPSISSVGDTYQLVARLHDPRSSTDVRTEQVRATGKNRVLSAVDELIAKIREDLGESLPAIAETSKPLAQATTSDMDALKQFSLAIEQHRAANFAEAKTYYENALRIDPGFTTAKAQLGILNSEFFDRAEGARLLSEAIANIDNLTDKEKYGILAFHARVVENDLPKAINLYKLLRGLHPDEWSVHNNIGWFSFQLGNGQEAVAAYKEALRLDPYAIISYNGFTMVYLYVLGDMDAALDIARREVAYDDRQWFAHENIGWALLGKGDLAAARQSFEKALEINENAGEVRTRLGYTHLLAGRYRDAVDMFLTIPITDPNDYYAYYNAGLACQLAGDLQCARQNLNRFIDIVKVRLQKQPNASAYQFDLAKALIRTGAPAQAQTAANAAFKLSPNNHYATAAVLSLQGKTDEAVARLEVAVQNGFRNYVWMKVDPDMQKLQNVPRFKELLKANLKGMKP